MRKLIPAALAAAALTFAGTQAFGTSTKEQVINAANEYIHALGDMDYDKACDLLTPRGQSALVAVTRHGNAVSSCPSALTELMSDMTDDSARLSRFNLTTDDVQRIDGNLADIRKFDHDSPAPGRLVKLNGRWLVDFKLV
jgi:hypothetical protein